MKKIVYTLSLLVLVFSSCTNDIVIEIPDTAVVEPLEDSDFQVDFDGETWGVEIENVTASIIAGVTTITATKNQEVFTLLLLNDQVGEYEVSFSDSNGYITYQPETGVSSFTTELDGASGSIGLSEINFDTKLLSGTFSFTGKRTFGGTDEVKSFTLGKFVNIPFTSEPDVLPTNSSFFAKIDGVEYEPDTIFADKNGGFILINALKETALISISLPDTIVTGDILLVSSGSSNIFSATYFPPVSTNTYITQPGIGSSANEFRVILHDETNKIIEGTFEFNVNDSTETLIESGDNLDDLDRRLIVIYS